MAVTLSSGGDATSMSFIGFTEDVCAAPNALCVPNCGEPNILPTIQLDDSFLFCDKNIILFEFMSLKPNGAAKKINSGQLNLKTNPMSCIQNHKLSM